MEVWGLSFLSAAEFSASSALSLLVFNGLETVDEEEEEVVESFFLVTASPVFFFTLSLLTLVPSAFALTFTFCPFSFLVLSI